MNSEGHRDLLEWLVRLGAQDRAVYREIRALLWAMFRHRQASRSGYSECPSKYS